MKDKLLNFYSFFKKNIVSENTLKKLTDFVGNVYRLCIDKYKKYPLKSIIKTIRKNLTIRSVKRRVKKLFNKPLRFISDFWKVILISASCFLFCYYIIGGIISEKINTDDLVSKNSGTTSQLMADLIEQEVNNNIWTPNLPIIFPAYILDNMPNFQVGIIYAIRDTASAMKNYTGYSPEQQKHIDKAYKFLKYSPYIWLLSQKSAFNIAPSSNSQYRKARRELLKMSEYDTIKQTPENFDKILSQISNKLTKLIEENENHITEHSSDWLDTKSDDLFYKNKGYAYTEWQITDSLGKEFKEIIVEADAYNLWTYLVNSLRKAAQMNPIMVRNGKTDNMISPNHLLVQNYFLSRAVTNIEKIKNLVWKKYANQN